MGKKITVDSATLVNKGLELIEAKHLYDVEYEQIQVVVHPQSTVHSMVEFCDNSIIAQLASTDMRLPIQYALTYPERMHSPTKSLDFWSIGSLNFEKPDIETFKDEQQEDYKKALATLNAVLLNLYKSGKQPQVNILTDRLQLDKMHNCDAGVNNITVAPNGRFYLCPAFYYDERMGINNRLNHHKPQHDYSVGDLDAGLQIPNQQLLRLDHAPLCRICDTYHCKRCVWLNQRLTWDANTPSHQQCVVSHVERNASRNLLKKLVEQGIRVSDTHPINEINYFDPFNIYKQWK
mgnify:CR=1 FL=1